MNKQAQLTKRESDVAKLTAYGFAKKEIAEMLDIAEMTVANTARKIYDKLSINSATQLGFWFFCKNNRAASFDKHDALRKMFEDGRSEKRTNGLKRRKDNLNCFA